MRIKYNSWFPPPTLWYNIHTSVVSYCLIIYIHWISSGPPSQLFSPLLGWGSPWLCCHSANCDQQTKYFQSTEMKLMALEIYVTLTQAVHIIIMQGVPETEVSSRTSSTQSCWGRPVRHLTQSCQSNPRRWQPVLKKRFKNKTKKSLRSPFYIGLAFLHRSYVLHYIWRWILLTKKV